MKYREITGRIWQIADDDGVYCTLVKGDNSAVLVDTGFGRQPLRAFVESVIGTELMVINTHGHPDHIGGNVHFDTVYAAENEHEFIRATHKEIRGEMPKYSLKPLEIGAVLDLGGITLKVISMAGHTAGSVGLLAENERILIAGDAINPCLWMFTPGALPIAELISTLKAVRELPFDNYIFGHSDEMLPKSFVDTILKNAESLERHPESRDEIMGIECYKCRYSDENGVSEIVFR